MRLVVTGGAGFIGSNFVRYMLARHDDVEIVNLDKLTYAGNLENLRDVEDDPRYSFVRGDICDAAVVGETLRGADAVVNFAAETHVDRSISGPQDFIRTDVLGTHTLLEAVRTLEIPRYLQISTDEVYGSIETGAFTEESDLDPSSPYSASKAGADLLVLAYHRTFGTPVLITRSSNNYGAWQYPEKIVPLFITNAIDDLQLPVYGDGLNVRDWLYVDDNCAGIDLVLREGVPGQVYNIGGGNEVQNLTITHRILELLGKGTRADPLRHRPPGARPALRHRLLQAQGSGLAPGGAVRGRAGAHRRLVRGQPRVVAARSSRASGATTTPASTASSPERGRGRRSTVADGLPDGYRTRAAPADRARSCGRSTKPSAGPTCPATTTPWREAWRPRCSASFCWTRPARPWAPPAWSATAACTSTSRTSSSSRPTRAGASATCSWTRSVAYLGRAAAAGAFVGLMTAEGKAVSVRTGCSVAVAMRRQAGGQAGGRAGTATAAASLGRTYTAAPTVGDRRPGVMPRCGARSQPRRAPSAQVVDVRARRARGRRATAPGCCSIRAQPCEKSRGTGRRISHGSLVPWMAMPPSRR